MNDATDPQVHSCSFTRTSAKVKLHHNVPCPSFTHCRWQVSGGAIMFTFVTGADIQSVNCSRANSQVPCALYLAS